MPRIQPQLPNIDQYASMKKQQEELLGQHAMFKKNLDERQAKTEARKTDLDVAGRVLKVLDSNVPKSARKFLNTQLAQYLGVDPKSEQFRGMDAMVMGLDPGSLMNLRSQFATNMESAEPGQISQMTKGLMTGQVPLDQFMNQVDLTGGMGQDQLAGGEVRDDQLGQPQRPPSGEPNTTIQAKTPQPFQGGPGSVQSFEGQRTIPPTSEQASPMLTGALGLDSRQRLRNNDLITNGYRIPMGVKDQEKLAESIVNRSVGLTSTISEAANMVDLFRGKPEVLGPVGSVARNVQSTVRQVEGVLNLIKPGATVDPADAQTEAIARRVGDVIGKAHKLDMTAENSARIQGMVLGLAYRMAVANDIPGNRLTNGIIQQNLAQLGNSASPEQFAAVLRDTIASTSREFDEHLKRTVGISGLEIMARQMADKDIRRIAAAGDILPTDMALAMRDEVAARLKGEPRNQIKPASPTLDEEERTLGGMEMEKKQRDIAKSEQDLIIDRNRDERAQRADTRAEGREERMTTAQENAARIEAERLRFQQEEAAVDNQRQDKQLDIAGRREDRSAAAQEGQLDLQRDQFEYLQQENQRDNARQDQAAALANQREDRLADASIASQKLAADQFEYKKIRDRQEDEKETRQAIANAFSQFAKAIANFGQSGGMGVSGVSGGFNQDTNAFRITPGPQRQAPRPAGGS